MSRQRAALALLLLAVLALAACANPSRVTPQTPRWHDGTTSPSQSPASPSPSPRTPSPNPTSPRPAPAKPKPAKPAGGSGPYGSARVTGSRTVALTFDDGPNPTYTPKFLALLRQYGIKATFCLVGTEAKRYPQLVQAIVRDGHTLCNHTWYHDLKLGQRSVSQIRSDLARTNAAIRAAVPGARIAYFRHPGGNWTPNAIAVARQLGMRSIHWAVDPQDWREPPASSIAARVINGTRVGAIVLMHDGGGERGNTCTALRSILPNLKRRFRLVAL